MLIVFICIIANIYVVLNNNFCVNLFCVLIHLPFDLDRFFLLSFSERATGLKSIGTVSNRSVIFLLIFCLSVALVIWRVYRKRFIGLGFLCGDISEK